MFFHCKSYFIQTVPPLSDIGRPTVQINITPFGPHKQWCVQKSAAQEGLCFVKRQTITRVLNIFTALIILHKENLTKNYIYESWSLTKDDIGRMETVLGFLSAVVK
jgi:hypothetical protein